MRMVSFLLLAACLSAHANSMAQTVTLSGKDIALRKIFAAVEKQTGYVLFAKKEILASTNTVSITAHKMPLLDFLDIVLKDQSLEYVIQGERTIMLSRKAPPSQAMFSSVVASSDLPPLRIRVTDADGNPLPGASVTNKKTKNSGVTDAEGMLSLNVAVGDVIEITFIGYEKQSLAVKDGTATIDVVLKPVETSLEEVVVSTDYFSTTKRRSTMSITRVDGKLIEKQPVTTLLNALIGLVPGLDITPTNGAPGSASKIEIRGRNSMKYTASGPLIVVDGIQVDSKPLQSYSNFMHNMYSGGFDPLAGINPADISSIEVLKDAAATAIYGTRGANGVIRITTKRAKHVSKNSFDLNAYRGAGWLPRKMEMMSREQYMEMRHEAYANDNLTPDNFVADVTGFWDTTRFTNWQEVLLGGVADITNLDGSYGGGNEFNSFRIAGGYHKETNIYPGEDFGSTRMTSNFSFNHFSTDKRLQVLASTSFGWVKTRSYSMNVEAAITLPPVAPKLYNEDGTLNWSLRPYFGRMRQTFENPMAYMERVNESEGNTLFVNGSISYELLPGLQIKTTVSHTHAYNNEHLIHPIKAYAPPSWPYSTGYASFNKNDRKSLMIEPQLNFDKKINDHRLSAVAGGSWQKSIYIFSSLMGVDYPSDAFLGSIRGAKLSFFPEDDNFQYRYASVYARVGYDFKGRYLFDLTGRRDGSSKFGPGKRFGNFGAVSMGWIFSEEPWLKSRWLSFGKLRGSYGLTGSDDISDYQYLDTYDILSMGYQNGVSLTPTALSNPDYRWENTTKLDIALELGLYNDRILVEVNWYKNRTFNQLVSYPLAYTTGFTGVMANFDAVVQNTGLELNLTSQNIATRHFRWTTSFNLTIPRNKLVKFDGIESSSYASRYKVGEPLSIQNLYKFKGINQQTGLYEVEDLDGDGNIDSQDMIFMDPLGRMKYAGLQNTFVYKNIDLLFSLQLSDNPIRNTMPPSPAGSMTNQPVEAMKRWRKPGDNQPYQRYVLTDYTAYYNAMSSDFDTRDGSFIRMRSLALGYRFNQALLKRAKITEARLYVQGQNVFTISKLKLGFDPETLYSLPPLRMLTLGLQVKF